MDTLPIRFLSLRPRHRTSAGVPELFDMKLRALRRDRAARNGPDLFLLDRVFDDCIERLALGERRFGRALLLGCPDPAWPRRLGARAAQIDVMEPGPLFAKAAGGAPVVEDAWKPPARRYDLLLAIGTLDSVNDLPVALRLIRHAMAADGLFMGALSGGDTLPQLRRAMLAADALAGAAAPHVHPRIEASALAPLLEGAGFLRPVVDVERVNVSYRSLVRLVDDLRGMAATNILRARPGPLGKKQWQAAAAAFAEAGDGERTIETFELLHFAAWTAADI